MAHEGQELRPLGDYFIRRRHALMSQGDIYAAAPIWLPPHDAMDPWDVMAGDVMVLTPSCWIDKQRDETERLCLVAPIVEVATMEWPAPDVATLREQDCLHAYMYLPEEGPWPERVVKFLNAEPIRYSLLNRCVRQTQLTYTANQQLMRKLALFFSTAHVPAAQFQPMSDDFPGESRQS